MTPRVASVKRILLVVALCAMTVGAAVGLAVPAQATAVTTISPNTIANPTVGITYSQMFVASGATAPYTFSISAGSLPPGLSLSVGGLLSGTPTASGPYSFTVESVDSNSGDPSTADQPYSVTVAAPTILVAPASVPNPTVGVAYSQVLTASGGTAPYTFAISAGALPAGLSLATNGALTGTPTASGINNFTVSATDSTTGTGLFIGLRAYTVTVAGPTITVGPNTLPNPTVSTAYSQTMTASGGTAPYTFTITAGALPAGLSLATNGNISGTPTAVGTANFTVTTTDSGSFTGTRAYTVTVASPTVIVWPTTLPAATAAVAYSQTISASGGTAPYTFAITSGALPAGLTLASTGALSGTPTTAGSFTFTVTATDSTTGTGAPFMAGQAYTVAVAAAAVVVTPATATVSL